MSQEWHAEVGIVGGGPAGCASALRLAHLGYDVLLVTRDAGRHLPAVETLAPAALPLLEVLGATGRRLAKCRLQTSASQVLWDCDATPATPGAAWTLIDRSQFDALLLRLCQEAGVRVLPSVCAHDAQRLPDQSWAIRSELPGQGPAHVHARLLIDASGRSGFLYNPRQRLSPPTIAISGNWRGVTLSEPRLEAAPDRWYWAASPEPGSTLAVLFLDPRRLRGVSRGRFADFYRAQLAQSRLLSGCLEGALDAVLRIRDASSSYANPADEALLRVGDASFTCDPLSSQGVTMALGGALQASVIANTILRRPQDGELAQDFYRRRQLANAHACHAQATKYYAMARERHPTPFWNERALRQQREQPIPPSRRYWRPGTRVRLSPEARWVDVAMLQGDWVVRVPGLTHPSLPEPVAYLGGLPLAALKSRILGRHTIREIQSCWPQQQALKASGPVLEQLWQLGVIEAVS